MAQDHPVVVSGPSDANRPALSDQEDNSVVQVRQDANQVYVNTGAAHFVFGPESTGFIQSVRLNDKWLMHGNTAPPLTAIVLQRDPSDDADDWSPVRRLIGQCNTRSFEHRQSGNKFIATTRGALTFDGGDAIEFVLSMTASAGSADIGIEVTLTPRGDFTDRYIHEVALHMPLALNVRKRVLQGAENGRVFDTRYFYQFHTSTVARLLKEAEINRWKHFGIDQTSPGASVVWRAESDSTSRLSMDHGRHATGWMGIYDEQGGVLFEYERMGERAPKQLHVLAPGGGTARVVLHPKTAPAVHPGDPHARQALFNVVHRTSWAFFTGEYADSGARLPSSSDVAAHPHAAEPSDAREASETDASLAAYVTGGVPFRRAALADARHVMLKRDDAHVPLQSRALAYWPDRSIKWLLLTFPLVDEGLGKIVLGSESGDTLPFDVTLRDGSRRRHELVFGNDVTTAHAQRALQVRTDERGNITIDTGPLTITCGQAGQWLSSIRLHGRELLSSPAQAYVDYLRIDGDYCTGTMHPSGVPDLGPVAIDKVELEETGPLRAVVRFEGRALCEEPANIVMRLRAYAGRPFVHITHSVVFMHKDIRRTFVRRVGLRLPLNVDESALRVLGGADDDHVAIALPAGGRAGLLQRTHHACEWWAQASLRNAHREVIRHAAHSRGWLAAQDGRATISAIVRDMWQQAPKQILAQGGDDPSLTIDLWPTNVPLMDVRRYSDYPHRSQGESVTDTNDWVNRYFHDNDPFVGVSKSHDVLLVFGDGKTTTQQLDAVAADFQRRPLVYAGARAYRDAGVTAALPAPDAQRFARANANLTNVADFWLFHQKRYGWYGMWNYGDFQHHFRDGYGWVLSPDALGKVLQLPADKRQGPIIARARDRDYQPQHDWAFDNGRWGWTNTEALPGLFLQIEYLRTGRRDLFFAAEAMARHVRDVDMRHAGQWFGKGTRHGVQHWSDGNHEERQAIQSETRFHYFLTGEERTRDFTERLVRQSHMRGRARIDAAHAGRLYNLLFYWELTGDQRVGELLRQYVRCFITPDGLAGAPRVEFSDNGLTVKPYEPPQEVHTESMFFHYFGALHALLEYHAITGDQVLRDALIRDADYAVQHNKMWRFTKTVAFAAEHATDRQRYREALIDWVTQKGYRKMYQTVTANPKHWTGPTAFLLGNVTGSFFWLNDMPYVMCALDTEPELSAESEAKLARIEQMGDPIKHIRERWQSEYDRPDLAGYLTQPE